MKRRSAVAHALVLAVLLAGCGKPPPAPEPVRSVRTITVAARPAGGVVEYAAEIRARTEARLGFRVGGKLIERRAEVGQHVRAGQVLARLDAEDLRLGHESAQAAVRAAQVARDIARADFKRFKDLRDQGFIGAAEFDRRDAALKAAEAQFEQARAQAAVLGNQATYSVLKASADGIVTAVEAEPGAVLAAGTPVLRLAVDGPRDAVFAVPEDVVAAVRTLIGKPGRVALHTWAGDERLDATLREVAAAADPSTRTYAAKADVRAPGLQLGQTATVTLSFGPRADVIRLPLSAVAERQGRTSVWVLDRATMTVRDRPIDVAGADANDVLVARGLAAGEVVVTAGVHVLTEGQVVKSITSAAPTAVPAASAASR